ncbi:MAG TPA: holo-ACP synthase [Bacillota bacterium]|nr:holo-ACP synthase [Bacillota bacterium]HPT86387.1 holo-ACP synthase [Bacillota bacterium]
MIVGTGIDIIEISRIAKAISNEHFVKRVYTDDEWAESKGLSHRLAGFFAAKEALLKAMGTGLAGFSWREMAVRHDANGAPVLHTDGKVARYLQELKVRKIHVSISHCREYAVAHVVLEAFE